MSSGINGIWTPANVEILRKRWGAPGQSASTIARAIGGITRDAVIGKAHRIGLPPLAPKRPQERPRRGPMHPHDRRHLSTIKAKGATRGR